jgi:hypothetical protein
MYEYQRNIANLKSLNEFVEDLKKHVSTETGDGLLKDSLTYTKHIHNIFGHKNCFKILESTSSQ